MTCVEALAGEVAVVKPQSAFFERHGSAGIAVLERPLAGARDGRHAVAARRQARRHRLDDDGLRRRPTSTDGQPAARRRDHVSPYLGYGSLGPALDLARRHGRGVFVLALTSNPEGRVVQHARRRRRIASPGAVVAGAPADNAGAAPLGCVGLVVGATVGSAVQDLGSTSPAVNGPLLAPGIGAQGAGAGGPAGGLRCGAAGRAGQQQP